MKFELPKPKVKKTEIFFVRIALKDKLSFFRKCRKKHIEPSEVVRSFINSFVESA